MTAAAARIATLNATRAQPKNDPTRPGGRRYGKIVREQIVALLRAESLTVAEVAERLELCTRTVWRHVDTIRKDRKMKLKESRDMAQKPARGLPPIAYRLPALS